MNEDLVPIGMTITGEILYLDKKTGKTKLVGGGNSNESGVGGAKGGSQGIEILEKSPSKTLENIPANSVDSQQGNNSQNSGENSAGPQGIEIQENNEENSPANKAPADNGFPSILGTNKEYWESGLGSLYRDAYKATEGMLPPIKESWYIHEEKEPLTFNSGFAYDWSTGTIESIKNPTYELPIEESETWRTIKASDWSTEGITDGFKPIVLHTVAGTTDILDKAGYPGTNFSSPGPKNSYSFDAETRGLEPTKIDYKEVPAKPSWQDRIKNVLNNSKTNTVGFPNNSIGDTIAAMKERRMFGMKDLWLSKEDYDDIKEWNSKNNFEYEQWLKQQEEDEMMWNEIQEHAKEIKSESSLPPAENSSQPKKGFFGYEERGTVVAPQSKSNFQLELQKAAKSLKEVQDSFAKHRFAGATVYKTFNKDIIVKETD